MTFNVNIAINCRAARAEVDNPRRGPSKSSIFTVKSGNPGRKLRALILVLRMFQNKRLDSRGEPLGLAGISGWPEGRAVLAFQFTEPQTSIFLGAYEVV
jgi:hypothetical protein